MIKKTLSIIALSGAMITSGYLFSIDNSTIVDGKLVEQNETEQIETIAISSNEANVNESNTIAETFISEEFVITYTDNNTIRGELLNGQGEGIYYELNRLDKKDYEIFSKLDVNDLVMIEWTTSNYNAGDWTDIERVLYNRKGNTYDSNSVNVAGVNGSVNE